MICTLHPSEELSAMAGEPSVPKKTGKSVPAPHVLMRNDPVTRPTTTPARSVYNRSYMVEGFASVIPRF
jgi:hypothetical protein